MVYKKEFPEVFKPLDSVSPQSPGILLWSIVCLIFLIICVFGVWVYRDMLKVNYVVPTYTNHTLPRVNGYQNIKTEEVIDDIPLFDEDMKETLASPVSRCENFRFHSVRFRHEAADLLIDGIIHNNTNSYQPMPISVYAVAYDDLGKILFQKEIFLPKENIQPYGQKAFFGTYSPAPDGVQWIEVSCKN